MSFLSTLKSYFMITPVHPHIKRSTRYLFIALCPLFLCWILFLNQSRKWAMTFTEKNATSQLEKNCMLAEQRMDSFYQSLSNLISSSTFNELILSSFEENAPSRKILSNEIDSILSQYFTNFDSIYSLYITSPAYSNCFYNAAGLPNIIQPGQISYYPTLSENPGTILWFPTTHCSDVIKINNQYNKYYSDYDVISLGVQMNLNYVKYSYLHKYTGTEIPPVILLNISPSIFDQWFPSDETTSYSVYTSDGDPIYTSGNLNTQELPVPLRADLNSNGQFRSSQNNIFMCSEILETNGWIITSYTSTTDTIKYLGSNISLITLLVICFTIVLVLIILHCTMSSISKPLTLLADGLNQTAAGNYEHRIFDSKYKDYQATFKTYNSMNQNIHKLITENYEIKLNEKELEIQIINLQFNPHFLYNMLNICSLMALDANQTKISDMLAKLSYMMRYSVKTKSLIVPFREDLRYVEAYIDAMKLRTNNIFTYKADIDPSVSNALVPKFLLQPFVENAIQHGFSKSDPTFPYHLHIKAQRIDNDIVFTIIDNGKGIEPDTYESLWSKNASGIGIANTHKRIQLYYGINYGVQIESAKETIVTVKIPYRQNQTL